MWQANDFWLYSIGIYQQASVKRACLAMQNQHGLNVNILLLCGYLTKSEIFINKIGFEYLIDQIKDLDKETSRLRQIRIASKNEAEKYSQLLKQELDLEKRQQQQLIASLNRVQETHKTSTLREQDNYQNYYYATHADNQQMLQDMMHFKTEISNLSI